MKVIINTAKLRETIALIGRIGGNKPTMPILGCYLLQADKNAQRLFISSTNLDLYIRGSLAVEVDEPGSICVSASMLQQISTNVPCETSTISVNKSSVVIESGKSRFKLFGITADEFPGLPSDPEGAEIVRDQSSLLQQLNAVSCAASTDETRYIINGVFLHCTGTKQILVATDGRRLHTQTESMEGAKSAAIIPNLSVHKLISLLKFSGKVTLRIGTNRASVLIERPDGDIQLFTKVVEGNYPNYQQVIPKEMKSFTVERELFSASISRVSMVTSEKSASMKFVLDGETLTLSAASPDLGEAKEEITVKNPAGIAGEVAINPKFIQQAVDAVASDTIEIGLKDAVSPVTVTATGFISVVMPVRLQ